MEDELQKDVEFCVDYEFCHPNLRVQALTHKSFHNENREASVGHNERMEFLGDSVLDLVLSEKLMMKFPDCSEGLMSKMRASLVNEAVLAEIALKVNMNAFVRLGRGEVQADGSQKPRILASTLEAYIGAIFLDGGYEKVRACVLTLFDEKLEELEPSKAFGDDAKTRLQEIVQDRLKTVPVYQVSGIAGPAHERLFIVDLSIEGTVIATGEGKSKKQAAQQAAAEALIKFK